MPLSLGPTKSIPTSSPGSYMTVSGSSSSQPGPACTDNPKRRASHVAQSFVAWHGPASLWSPIIWRIAGPMLLDEFVTSAPSRVIITSGAFAGSSWACANVDHEMSAARGIVRTNRFMGVARVGPLLTTISWSKNRSRRVDGVKLRGVPVFDRIQEPFGPCGRPKRHC